MGSLYLETSLMWWKATEFQQYIPDEYLPTVAHVVTTLLLSDINILPMHAEKRSEEKTNGKSQKFAHLASSSFEKPLDRKQTTGLFSV